LKHSGLRRPIQWSMMDTHRDDNPRRGATRQVRHPDIQSRSVPVLRCASRHQPVCRVTLPDRQQAWVVTRYADVVAYLKDSRLAKDRKNAMTAQQIAKQPWLPGFVRPLQRNMLDLDDPDHARLRALVHKAFS
jgi:cytochrome P450